MSANLDAFAIKRAETGRAVQSTFLAPARRDVNRVEEAMTFWGQEAAWWLHRIDRLTLERDALDAWCDTHEDWNDPRFLDRNHRAIRVYGLREVARLNLREIAAKVDDLAKRHPKEMGRLTEAFVVARQGPTPPVRPTQRAIGAD